jgi:hypothetical protein
MFKEDKMDKQERIREEVEKTMSLLDRMQNLEADPYFYIRIEARLRSEEREKKTKLMGYPGAGVLKPALLLLLLMINLISVFFILKQSGDTGLAEEKYRSRASQLVREYWPTQDTYDISLTEKMTGGSK